MSSPYLFIFEMANNHMGDVAHGIRIIKELKEACAGFDFRFAVKLQYRNLPEFIHPDFRNRTDLKFVKRFSETTLSWTDYKRLKDAIVEHGFLAVCTPFDEFGVDKVVDHGFDYLKVASCSATDWPLAEKIATTTLPIILSTAGESFEDLDRIVSFYQHRNKKLTLLHCIGEYPTAPENFQLNQIDLLKKRYGDVDVGYSTHESPDEVQSVMMAIAKGAVAFEKHVGLKTGKYAVNAYSASPSQVRTWLDAARKAIAMAGHSHTRHAISAAEERGLGELRRAVFTRRALAEGEVIRPEDLFFAIPGKPEQLVTRDLSKYTEYKMLRKFGAGEGIMRNDVSATDTRSAVHGIVRDVKALLKASGVAVPSQLELEISHHYGIDRFREVGSAMITVINREYCKRLVLMLPGQSHPSHWHKLKDETFHLLYGEIDLVLDGETKECIQNDVIVIPRGSKHEFRSPNGTIIEEISSTHSLSDSYYEDRDIPESSGRKTYVTNWMD